MGWDLADFVIAGTLLMSSALVFRIAVRRSGNIAYRAAVGLALITTLLLIWINLAVGIIGNEGNPANKMYIGVIAVFIVGTLIARLRPMGMVWVLSVTATTQTLVTLIAMTSGMSSPESPPLEILALNVFFTALWIGSAFLFRRSTSTHANQVPQKV